VESYTKAIQLKPSFPEPYCNRGVSLQSLGHLKEAGKSFEKAIQLRPDYAEAHLNLSMQKEFKRNDLQIEVMERLHSDSGSSADDRMRLCFALGKAFEDLDESDKVFHYLDEGNRLRRKELNYNIVDDKRLMARIRNIFSAGLLCPETPTNESLPKQPIFIVGMPRSGTSLAEQILASHSKVYGAGELSAMDRLMGLIFSKLPIDDINLGMARSSGDLMTNVRDGYLRVLNALEVPERVITDKMPLNFRWIGFILSAFPDARIVNLTRDPRASCWSIYKRLFSMNGNGFAYSLSDLAQFYRLYTDLMSYWSEHFPNAIYNLCYEDLTQNQEEETRKTTAVLQSGMGDTVSGFPPDQENGAYGEHCPGPTEDVLRQLG
jgi:tetratricopeptide (TPR) repeat protein